MKQLLLRKGTINIEDVPAPALGPKQVLVEVGQSLISTGTEISSVNLSGASLIEKAKQRPKEVEKVLQSIRVRGLKKTLALVQSKLDESKPLGYSCSGRVIAVGRDVQTFSINDRVACAGATFANHAEVVSVPVNLVVKIPEGVDDKSASAVTIGAIALQGVRRADVRLGETVCVMGLGLIGQITVQLLNAAGCRTIGLDPEPNRVKMALDFGLHQGAASPKELAEKVKFDTGDVGVDSTIITASTDSSTPARQAFEITRKKGKIVVVGAVGMNLDRSPFYEKEQDFLISCSYGPGRYDPTYEKEGQDYPLPYVRWTENRNMVAFLNLLQDKKIDVDSLITEELTIDEAPKAYEKLKSGNGNKPLAVVLSYPQNGHQKSAASVVVGPSHPKIRKEAVRLGLIGVGNFTKTTHLPNLKIVAPQVQINAVCSETSASAATVGRQVKAHLITTNYQDVIHADDVDAVLIATRHNKHAEMALQALKAGKHVFLEKPLALTFEELNELNQLIQNNRDLPTLMVGLNRRYAPFTLELQDLVKTRTTPLVIQFRVNAGSLPLDHWTKTDEGGGRLRGEACHMIDFFQTLVGARLKSVSIQALTANASQHFRPDENFNAQFVYEDGSVGNLIYTSAGSSKLSKEHVEIHWDGNSALIDDFKSLRLYGPRSQFKKIYQDKGHKNTLRNFFEAIEHGTAFPIDWTHLFDTTQATIELDREVWGKSL